MNKVGEAANVVLSSSVGGGTAVTIVALAGEVAGLSGAGIMSGLAAAGAVVGGGAAAGIVTVAAAGAVVDFGVYKGIKWLFNR